MGQVDKHGKLSGDSISYIYTDKQTMIVGKFEDGVLVSGQEGFLVGLEKDVDNGLMKPLYYLNKANTDRFRFSESNQTYIGDDPTVRDPLEDKYLFVGNSMIEGAGRGVFLKNAVKKGTMVGFYNGVRMSSIESKLKREDRKSPYRMDNDWAVAGQVLNIPPEYR